MLPTLLNQTRAKSSLIFFLSSFPYYIINVIILIFMSPIAIQQAIPWVIKQKN